MEVISPVLTAVKSSEKIDKQVLVLLCIFAMLLSIKSEAESTTIQTLNGKIWTEKQEMKKT